MIKLKLILSLWSFLSQTRRKQFILLFFLMIFGSLAESLSVVSALPFLTALTDPDRILTNPHINLALESFGISSSRDLVFFATISFCVFLIFSAVIRLSLLWLSTKVSFLACSEISSGMYKNYLFLPYKNHIQNHSSNTINDIIVKTDILIYQIVMPFVGLISSFFISVMILSILFFVNALITLVTLLFFVGIYLFIAHFAHKRLLKNSVDISIKSSHAIKSIQEGLGAIRDVIIDGSQAVFLKKYQESDKSLRASQSSNTFVAQSPRFAIESLGMLFFAYSSYYYLKRFGSIIEILPLLGMFIIASQRLLPLFQQIYHSWSSIAGNVKTLKDVLMILDSKPLSNINHKKYDHFQFNKNIKAVNLGFRYDRSSPWIFKNLNFEIQKGSRIGIIGSTGSGKSTLVDLIMGLLSPSEGSIKIDGQTLNENNCKSWYKRISHVPQSIFLTDSSIAENIAFGENEKDWDYGRVIRASNLAQLSEYIESLPKKYNTLVGERGVLLSGGQLQRIGIARALYKNADIIIFDEATSALDTKTEAEITKAIELLGGELTVIVIAHRLSALKICSQILELDNGSIKFVKNNNSTLKSNKKVNKKGQLIKNLC
jgi:ABC-type multidrug transport system fused ATPase/permease subunit